MSTETPCCAHNQVVLKRKNHPGGTCSDYWECYDCGTGFWPAHYNDQLKREVTEFFADLQAAKAEVERLTKLIEDACGSPLSMAFKVQKWTECEQDRDAWRADAAALAKAGMNCVTCSSDIEGTSSVSVYKAELQDLVTALAHHDELVSRL